MSKEIPILFSTPMVQAILDGRKTMTRRIVKPQPDAEHKPGLVPRSLQNENDWGKWYWDSPEGETIVKQCPYGQPGDILWVRESWKPNEMPIGWPYHYKALNDTFTHPKEERWKPPIHMPKAACRIWLEVTEVRAERLQDISEEDAKSEGVIQNRDGSWHDYIAPERLWQDEAKPSFQSLWESINGPENWEANPWVWVVSFKILSTTGKPNL